MDPTAPHVISPVHNSLGKTSVQTSRLFVRKQIEKLRVHQLKSKFFNISSTKKEQTLPTRNRVSHEHAPIRPPPQRALTIHKSCTKVSERGPTRTAPILHMTCVMAFESTVVLTMTFPEDNEALYCDSLVDVRHFCGCYQP